MIENIEYFLLKNYCDSYKQRNDVFSYEMMFYKI